MRVQCHFSDYSPRLSFTAISISCSEPICRAAVKSRNRDCLFSISFRDLTAVIHHPANHSGNSVPRDNAIRTRDWSYSVADHSGDTNRTPAAITYHEYQLQDQRRPARAVPSLDASSPAKLRRSFKGVEAPRRRGEAEPEIVEAKLYP